MVKAMFIIKLQLSQTLSLTLSVSLSFCLSLSFSVSLSQSVFLSISLALCISVSLQHLSVGLFLYLLSPSVCLSVSLLSLALSVGLSVSISLCQSVCFSPFPPAGRFGAVRVVRERYCSARLRPAFPLATIMVGRGLSQTAIAAAAT